MEARALILAGGRGTRLRPLTITIPKPLLPLGDRSILELLVERLSGSGIRNIYLSVGYHSALVRAFCGDGSKFDVSFTYLEESEPLGTAGPVRLLDGQVDPSGQIILVNGDVVTDLDFSELLRFHEQQGCELTICYKEFRDTSPFGVLKIEGTEIVDIVEKPTRVEQVSVGIYVLDASLIQEIPPDQLYTIPELAMKLIDQGRPIAAFPVECFWLGIERFSDLEEALSALESVEGRWQKA